MKAQTASGGEEDQARHVARLWGLQDLPERLDLGVNKGTWKVGSMWLSCQVGEDTSLVTRLHHLLNAVSASCPDVAVPRLVPTGDGEFVRRHAGRTWWVTAHVGGRQPEAGSAPDMEAVGRGLARLHACLRPVPRSLACSTEDMVSRFEAGVALAHDPRLGFSARDHDVVDRAEHVIRDRLSTGDLGSRQLLHGDPSNPNLRLSVDGEPRLTGALDWDSARGDVPLVDLATVAQTVVLRSGWEEPLDLLDLVVDEYRRAGGQDYTVGDVLVGLLLVKFESVAHHGRRFLAGQAGAQLVANQPGKLAVVLDVLERWRRAHRH